MVKITFNLCLAVVVIALICIVIRQELVIDRLEYDIEVMRDAHNKNADTLSYTLELAKTNRDNIYDVFIDLEELKK